MGGQVSLPPPVLSLLFLSQNKERVIPKVIFLNVVGHLGFFFTACFSDPGDKTITGTVADI